MVYSVHSFVFFDFFFFKQKTAYEMRISDWSSDVCSSDLQQLNSQRLSQHIHNNAVNKADHGDRGQQAQRQVGTLLDHLHGRPSLYTAQIINFPGTGKANILWVNLLSTDY